MNVSGNIMDTAQETLLILQTIAPQQQQWKTVSSMLIISLLGSPFLFFFFLCLKAFSSTFYSATSRYNREVWESQHPRDSSQTVKDGCWQLSSPGSHHPWMILRCISLGIFVGQYWSIVAYHSNPLIDEAFIKFFSLPFLIPVILPEITSPTHNLFPNSCLRSTFERIQAKTILIV